MKHHFLIESQLILHFILLFDVLGQGPTLPKTPLRTHFESSQYGGGIQNWDFDVDSKGILYVANNDGILSFDGANWKTYRVPGATKVRAVFIDDNDRIYAGGQGQIGYFEQSDLTTFNSLLDQLDKEDRDISETWNITMVNDKVYFGTMNKVFVLTDGSFLRLTMDRNVRRIFTVENDLIIQLNDGTVLQGPETDLKETSGLDQILPEITGVAKRPEGTLIFSKDGKVFQLDSAGSLVRLETFLDGNIINTVIELSNHTIGIGTQNNGLIIIDKNFNLKAHYTKNLGISNRTVTALLEDRFNNLWIGLHNGIDYLELSNPLTSISEKIGFEGTGYAAAKWGNKTYLGTNNGLFLLKDKEFELISGSEGQVYNLSTVNGSLFLNHHTGAYLVDDSGLRQIHGNGSWLIKQTPIDNIYLAGGYDGIRFIKHKDQKWSTYSEVLGLNESSRVIEFENDSTLWMTHGYKGAFRIVMNKDLDKTISIKRYGKEDGFPSNNLINVYKIDGNLIFTSESGFFDFDKNHDRFVPNEFMNSIFGEGHISEMASMDSGEIYFLQDRKLGRLVQESLGSYRKETNIFNRVNKYLSDDLEVISILDQNNLLIGAKDGFIHFDPTSKFEPSSDFEVLIQGVRITSRDSSEVYSSESFSGQKLKHNESIKVGYASPYFDGFEELEYSYRLYPIAEKWSDWDKSTEREFAFLPSGKYSLEIRARNAYGDVSKKTSIQFVVMEPWYSTPLAVVSLAGATFLFFVLFSFFQRRKHKEEKAELNRSKVEAIKMKDQEISEIEEESRSKIDKLKNEKLKNEIQHKNSQLTSVTTHLLQKNELLKEIAKNIESSIEKSGSKGDLKKIVKSIERNLTDDESWDQFSIHFNEVHGDFFNKLTARNIKLTPQETKLAAYLRMNMSSKEIANLMNISVRGVELARYRLRKKLDLDRDQKLVEYLLEIN